MVGTYHQFGAFVSGVASLPRVVIMTMHNISLTPRAGQAGPAGAPGHRPHLSLPRRRRNRERQFRRGEQVMRMQALAAGSVRLVLLLAVRRHAVLPAPATRARSSSGSPK
jgi:type IV pilus assembly protein PilO